MNFLAVGLGGFLGAISRYLVYLAEPRLGHHVFPWGTLVINSAGCFLAGLVLGLVELNTSIDRQWILLLSMGYIGSFTTFSTYSVESFQLLRSGSVHLAVASIAANIILGLAFVWLGHWVLKLF